MSTTRKPGPVTGRAFFALFLLLLPAFALITGATGIFESPETARSTTPGTAALDASASATHERDGDGFERDFYGRLVRDGDGPILYDRDTTEPLRQAREAALLEAHIDGLDRRTAGSSAHRIAISSDTPNKARAAEKALLPSFEDGYFLTFGDGIGNAGLVSFSTSPSPGDDLVAVSASVDDSSNNRYWYVGFEDPNGFYVAWRSELYDEDISSLAVADLDGDGNEEVFIAYGNKMEIRRWQGGAMQFVNGFTVGVYAMRSLHVVDIDNDGALELVFTDESHTYYYGTNGAYETTVWGRGGKDLAIADLDGDGNLEIAIAAPSDVGDVIDGVTQALEWSRPDGFGWHVEAADVDGDGDIEVVGADRWADLVIADGATGVDQWTGSASLQVDALALADIDGDGLVEVIYGDGQWGSLHVLDGATGAEEQSIANALHGVTNILFTDTGSGPALYWGAGFTSSGDDGLNLWKPASSSLFYLSPDLRGPFYGSAYGEVFASGTSSLVLGAFDSADGDGRHVLVSPSDDQILDVGPEPTGSAITGLWRLRTHDITGEGLEDVILGTDRGGFGKIVALAYPGPTQIWETAEWQGLTFQALEITDLEYDGDLELLAVGSKTSVAATGSAVMIFDLLTGALEWQSPDLSTDTVSFPYLGVGDVDGDFIQDILVAQDNGNLHIFDGATRAEVLATTGLSLVGMDVTDIDNDGLADVVVGNLAGKLYRLDPSTGSEVENYGSFTSAHSGQLEDVNYDGAFDRIFVNGDRVEIRSGLAGDLLWSSPTLPAGSGQKDGLLIGDIDADSYLEVGVGWGASGFRTWQLDVSYPNPSNQPPTLQITDPLDGTIVQQGQTLYLSANASDPEEGDLSNSVAWASSLDGHLGTGLALPVQLSPGTHQLTAAITDFDNASAWQVISLTVEPGAGTCDLLAEDFETGGSDWTAGGLWHLVADSTCAIPGYGSSVTAYYFGQDGTCNYSTGGIEIGDLISPEIYQVGAQSELSFNYFREVENGGSYDSTDVSVRVVGAPEWTSVWFRDSSTASAGSWQPSGGISLSAWAGQDIELRFRFDSVDSAANTFVGWFVDDVFVTGGSCGQNETTVTITDPADGSAVPEATLLTFSATAETPGGSDISEYLLWSSDIDGPLGGGGGGGGGGAGGTIQHVLDVGTHVVTATVDDGFGHVGSDSITVEVGDNQPPTVTVISPADGTVGNTTDGFYVTASGNDPEGQPLTWEWSSDIDGVVGVGFDTDFTLSRGIHLLTASASDGRGGVGSDSIYVVAHDTSDLPLVRILAPAEGASFPGGSDVGLLALADDLIDGNMGPVVEWLVDGNVVGQGASYTHNFASSGNPVVTARVLDQNSNAADDSISLVITDPPPTITIFYPFDGGVHSAHRSLFLESEASDGTLIPDAPSWSSDIDGFLGVGPYFGVNLTPGVHVLTATATGFTGVEASKSITVTMVDAVAPTASIDAPADAAYLPKSNVDFFSTFSVDAAATASLQWISDIDGLLGTAEDITVAALTPATHRITFRVIDSFEQTAEDTIDIFIANSDAPQVTITAPTDGASVVEGVAVDLTATVVDEDPQIEVGLSWTSDLQGQLGFGPTVNVDDLVVGVHTITASVMDSNSLSGSDSITLTVTANDPPSVSLNSPGDGTSFAEGETVSFQGTATDAQEGDLSAALQWSSSQDGALGSGPSITSSILSPGQHVIRASVTDSSAAEGFQEATITVLANQSPVVSITAPAPGSHFVEGTNIAFVGTASDAEDGDLAAAIQWSSDIDGALGSGGSLSISSLTVAEHQIRATVTDSFGAVTFAELSVFIDANTAPAVHIDSPTGSPSAALGATVSFAGTASDTEDGDLSAALAWTSDLDGQIGVGASFATTSLSLGSHTITASATDSHGASGIDTITVLITPSSLAHWPLDDGSGATATDASGNGHDGSLETGPTWTDGILGGGLSFDGNSDLVRVAAAPDLDSLSELTVSAWINHPAQGGWYSIVDKRDAGNDGFDLYLEPGRRAFVRINTQTLTGTTVVADNAWHHVVGVYDGTEIRIYIDGVLDISGAANVGTVDTSADLFLGRNYSNGSYFRGTLDEVQLYDRALDATEIAELFDAPPPQRSNGAPSGSLPGGTTQADLTLDTDEVADCRWSGSQGTPFDSMVETFSNVGGLAHTATVTGLVDGGSYQYYVRCRDAAGSTNDDDYSIAFQVATPPDLTTDLEGYWSLDEGSGSTAADGSSLGHDGTVAGGAAWITGQVNGGLAFDGTDDSVTVAHTPELGSMAAVSIAAWVRVQAADGGSWQSVVDKRDGNLDGYDLYLSSSNRLFLRINDQTLQGSSSLNDGSWHHVVGIYDGADMLLYVDGVLQASKTVGVETLSTSNPLHIGQNWQVGSFYLTGDVDEVRVYSRALTASEVGTLAAP